jgi:hypothetical protein
VVTGHHLLEGDRDEQVAALGAFLLMLQQTVGPGQPSAGLRQLPLVDQVERQPERAPCGPPEIAVLGMEPLGAPQGPQAVLQVAEEIGGGRQQLQVLTGQRGRAVGERQGGLGVGPRQPAGGLAATDELAIPDHPCSPPEPSPDPDPGSVAVVSAWPTGRRRASRWR